VGLEPGARLGRYKIVELLGRGGMGSVYRAIDEQVGRTVALKVVSPRDTDERQLRRFRRESRAGAGLSHPNLVTTHDAGEIDGTPFIALELVPGGTLKEKIEERHQLPWREAAAIGAEIARGLAYLHASGAIHRDLKPENVLLDGQGRPKISDFGLIHEQEPSPLSKGGLTKTGEFMGTLEYVAPEQCAGSKEIDRRADLYSLGAMLHMMLTGQPPFTAKSYALITAHLTEKPKPPSALVPEVPRALDVLVLRLLEKLPARRPSSAEEVAVELERIAAPEAKRATGGRGLLLGGVGAAVLAGVAVVAVIAFGPGSSPKTSAPDTPKRPDPPKGDPPKGDPPKVPTPPRKPAKPWNPSWKLEVESHARGAPKLGVSANVVWDGHRFISWSGDPGMKYPRSRSVYAFEAGAWTMKLGEDAPGPTWRMGACMAAVDGEILLFGGRGDAEATTDTWTYDPNANVWTEKSGASPTPRTAAFAGSDGHSAYVFGGGNWNELWKYERSSGWKLMQGDGVSGSPPARSGDTLVWDGTRLLLFGGMQGESLVNDLWWYEPGANRWTRKKDDGAPGSPPPRISFGTAWDGQRMLVFGGWSASHEALDELWAYDPETNAWEQRAKPDGATWPPARGAARLVAGGGRCFLFGGLDAEEYRLNDVWSLASE
jgi:serine/threonine protein kinase